MEYTNHYPGYIKAVINAGIWSPLNILIAYTAGAVIIIITVTYLICVLKARRREKFYNAQVVK